MADKLTVVLVELGDNWYVPALDSPDEYEARVARLATYNSEKSRGIYHHTLWVNFMQKEQEWFDGTR